MTKEKGMNNSKNGMNYCFEVIWSLIRLIFFFFFDEHQ